MGKSRDRKLPKIKVYCDRVAVVLVNKKGEFECPKCQGTCTLKIRKLPRREAKMYDCDRCGRGWEEVPMEINTEREALDHLCGIKPETDEQS